MFENIDENKISPLLKQYIEMKKKNAEYVLLFRVGDFYECFFDDAIYVSKELELVLTGKECGLEERAPMAGIPHMALDIYVAKLIEKNRKVAVAEQIEDPKEAKGLVKREITQYITPGITICDDNLKENENNYCISLVFDGESYGVAIFDFSTGIFNVTNINNEKDVLDMIEKYRPKEILYNNFIYMSKLDIDNLAKKYDVATTLLTDDLYDDKNLENHEYLKLLVKNFYKDNDLSQQNVLKAIISSYMYIFNSTNIEPTNISNITYLKQDNKLIIDNISVRNLELVESIFEKEKKGSLLYVLDKTKTAMGSRLLKRLVLEPLNNKKDIEDRYDAIEELMQNYVDGQELSEYLNAIYDFERIITKMNMRHASPRDLLALRNSLAMLPHIYNIIKNYKCDSFTKESTNFDTLKDLYDLIDKSISEEAPVLIHNGEIIKDGYNTTLDQYRDLKNHGKEKIIEFEEKIKNEYGIKNLKIKRTKLFGYIIEISNVYKGEIPSCFIRKQTVTNAERYTTEELMKLQNDIANSEEKIKTIEYDLFNDIVDMLLYNIVRIKRMAKSIAYIDCINSLAMVSLNNNYVRPSINEESILEIKGGRHPVVETLLSYEDYIPNDTNLSNINYIDIITGPNMAGKSTYMKQIALICIMAHIGCFVPCISANICILDRIFTRIGASDDILRGKSTFMVEMSEVANIIDNATDKSLVLLDEIGRGTSTYDGMSIAYAILEYISKNIKSKTIFSTHYHELTKLEGKLSGVRNFNITCEEKDDTIKFLRKIVKGGSDKSYGIQVAKLSGIKTEIIERANEILEGFSNV